ncbi:hypothetical protein A2U01_0057039, partial [Trifolium medium]|nr:hypothetical protein [Trifolium medium]
NAKHQPNPKTQYSEAPPGNHEEDLAPKKTSAAAAPTPTVKYQDLLLPTPSPSNSDVLKPRKDAGISHTGGCSQPSNLTKTGSTRRYLFFY